uniref:Uncharacterized protein n=1 Tax=Romanomermis culicivorax TaxID=13658 RepID=A0A915JGE3_ROMCU
METHAAISTQFSWRTSRPSVSHIATKPTADQLDKLINYKRQVVPKSEKTELLTDNSFLPSFENDSQCVWWDSRYASLLYGGIIDILIHETRWDNRCNGINGTMGESIRGRLPVCMSCIAKFTKIHHVMQILEHPVSLSPFSCTFFGLCRCRCCGPPSLEVEGCCCCWKRSFLWFLVEQAFNCLLPIN